MPEDTDNRAQILLKADDVSVVKHGTCIVQGVTLALQPREIVTLVGPNGAGKTTLIRALLGLETVAEGRVTRAPHLRIGYVPQRLNLEPIIPLTIDRLMRLNTEAKPADIGEVLSTVGLAERQRDSVHDLSGGEFQRMMLARALLRRPNLLVLDEPTQNVDVAGAAELYRLIGDIRDTTGAGILMVSHDLNVVMASTDQVYCLHHHICCSGKPNAVRNDPAFRALFGSAADTLAVYAHDHDHEHDPAGEVVGHGGHP